MGLLHYWNCCMAYELWANSETIGILSCITFEVVLSEGTMWCPYGSHDQWGGGGGLGGASYKVIYKVIYTRTSRRPRVDLGALFVGQLSVRKGEQRRRRPTSASNLHLRLSTNPEHAALRRPRDDIRPFFFVQLGEKGRAQEEMPDICK